MSITAMRATSPGMGIEVLIPDFDGSDDRLRTVMDARPDILNHNLETVKRLQKPVRKRARWDRSLYVLRRAKQMAGEIGYAVHTMRELLVWVPWAWTDETTTIDPRPLRRRWGRAARAARKTPWTWTAKTSSQVASSVSTTLP